MAAAARERHDPKWQTPEFGLPLIPKANGLPFDELDLNAVWERGLLRSGFPVHLRIGLGRTHLYRHLYMCLLLEACGDVQTVADIMAVKREVVDRVYATIPRDRRRKITALADTIRRDRVVIAELGRSEITAAMQAALDKLTTAADHHDVPAAETAVGDIQKLAHQMRAAVGRKESQKLTTFLAQLRIRVNRLFAEAREQLYAADEDDVA